MIFVNKVGVVYMIGYLWYRVLFIYLNNYYNISKNYFNKMLI